MFTRADVPLLVTFICAVTLCPEITDDGETERAEVKLPIYTVFDIKLRDSAVPPEFVALVVKYTLPELSALYLHSIVRVSPDEIEKGVRLKTIAPEL